MKKAGDHIQVNFGDKPFVFDIDGMMKVRVLDDLACGSIALDC